MVRSSVGMRFELSTVMKYLWPLSFTRSIWQLLSRARILAQMKTRIGRRLGAGLCSSLSTYGKMPTESARLTAHGPWSRKRPSRRSARNRWVWLSSTCSTMGSCSGGFFCAAPNSSHTSKAVSWSAKKGLGSQLSSCGSSSRWSAICERQTSAARSQADHIGCWCVSGSGGWLTGVQLAARRMRSASRKLRKSDATSRSCRKSFWKTCGGSVFQAIVSVMAVKIQFSSPSGVRRSLSRPGMLSIRSRLSPLCGEVLTNQRSAIFTGVVRQAVKVSAGSCALVGSSSPALQAASRMLSVMGAAEAAARLAATSSLSPRASAAVCRRSYSLLRCSIKWLYQLTTRPAPLQSST
mmetsp:Transcript_42962/g.108450  ORF Transcript_42962/g.108450 Transcript_42962/m.108450 type:complete len:351 (-) Transcript_42962:1043-2095(-)